MDDTVAKIEDLSKFANCKNIPIKIMQYKNGTSSAMMMYKVRELKRLIVWDKTYVWYGDNLKSYLSIGFVSYFSVSSRHVQLHKLDGEVCLALRSRLGSYLSSAQKETLMIIYRISEKYSCTFISDQVWIGV